MLEDNYHELFSHFYIMQMLLAAHADTWLADPRFEQFCVNEIVRSGLILA